VCHLYSPETCAEIVQRLTPALAEGGVLAIIETLDGGSGSAVHDLSLFLRTREGGIHHPDSCADWLAGAGLTDITSTDVPSELTITVITGRKAPDGADTLSN
jgi:hypothetical protein